MKQPAGYEDTFRRFDEAGGKWVPNWNWAAFLLTIIWYFYHGLWVKGLIYTGVYVLLSSLTYGLFSIPLWIVCGLIGSYDLYLLKCKGTQLWDGGGVNQKTMDTLQGLTGSHSASAASRLHALENARQQNVISEIEYNEKRRQLEKELEIEKKIKALEDMRRSGIISAMEYEARKREILLEKVPS